MATQQQREELLQSGYPHHGWWDFVYEDFLQVCSCLGITVKHEKDVAIYFSGFSSQGDGACWEGTWSPKIDAHKSVTAYASQDKELLRIAAELTAISTQLLILEGMSDCSAKITSGKSRYYHSYTMEIALNEGPEDDEEYEALSNTLLELFRDLADWLYKALETEYDCLISDEALDEVLSSSL